MRSWAGLLNKVERKWISGGGWKPLDMQLTHILFWVIIDKTSHPKLSVGAWQSDQLLTTLNHPKNRWINKLSQYTEFYFVNYVELESLHWLFCQYNSWCIRRACESAGVNVCSEAYSHVNMIKPSASRITQWPVNTRSWLAFCLKWWKIHNVAAWLMKSKCSPWLRPSAHIHHGFNFHPCTYTEYLESLQHN